MLKLNELDAAMDNYEIVEIKLVRVDKNLKK
jgi:hypothetical protein